MFNRANRNKLGTISIIFLGTSYIYSFISLSYDRSKASSKASSPHSAIQSFLFQMRVTSPFLKADSHIACRAHAVPMPRPCRSPAMTCC
jgi:hypothetical protein